MEVNLLHRHTVDLALRLGDAVIDRQNILPHRLRQLQMVLHQMADLPKAAMGMGTPMVVMLPLLLPAHQDGQMGAGDAAFDAPLQGKGHPRQAQAVEPVHKGPRFRQQLQQGRRQHVPCRAHATVQIQCLHCFASM